MIIWLFLLSTHLLASTWTFVQLEYDPRDTRRLQIFRWICILIPSFFWLLFGIISAIEFTSDIARSKRLRNQEAADLRQKIEANYDWYEDKK